MKRFAAILLVFLFLTPLFAYDVILKSGKKFSGKLIREDSQSIIVKDQSGTYHNFKKTEVDLAKTAVVNKNPKPAAQSGKRVYTNKDFQPVREKFDLGEGSLGETSKVDLSKPVEDAGAQAAELSAFRKTVSQSDQKVLVEFWAEWSSPCKKFAPVFERVASEHEEDFNVIKINIDEKRAIASAYEVRAIPTVLFFKDGKLVDRLVGAVSTQVLSQKLRSVFNLQ